MAKVSRKTLLLVTTAFVFLCALVVAIPYAYGYSYIHTEAESDASNSGVIAVCLTVDKTEIGEGITAALVHIPSEDNTVDALFAEGALSGENRGGTDSHYNYDYVSVAEYLADKEYTVSVYAAGAQEMGAVFDYTSPSIGDQSYADLERFDGVYVKVTG